MGSGALIVLVAVAVGLLGRAHQSTVGGGNRPPPAGRPASSAATSAEPTAATERDRQGEAGRPGPRPGENPVITEFPLARIAQPRSITAGADGNLWFTEITKIGRITPTGAVTEFPLAPPGDPVGIARGPDGNIWFADESGKVGRVTPTGSISEFTVPNPGSGPFGITLGPDRNLWFTEASGDRIGRITPSGAVTEFALPPRGAHRKFRPGAGGGDGPTVITSGADGHLWFAEEDAHRIGRMGLDGGLTELPSPPTTDILGIEGGPDSQVWLTLSAGATNAAATPDASRIRALTVAGGVADYPVPTAASMPFGLSRGDDGSVWFVEHEANKVGRLDGNGTIREWTIPTPSSGPEGIARAADGAMWFTENASGKIGRISA